MKFYYAVDGKPLGPVSSEELQKLRSQATIDDNTLIVAEGEARWVSYGERFPSGKDKRPASPPLLVNAADSPASRPVAGDAPAPASPSPTMKEKISAAAYQRAMAATSRKDEFDTSDALEFPAVRYQFPLDLSTPKLCIESFLVVPGHPQVALQLMIWNRSDHGLVHYDTVKASGGIELQCKHLNSKPFRTDSSPTEWQETITIFIPVELLLRNRKEPLRLQISRPNEGKAFVINISPDSVSAVLYRVFPDRYEVDSADLKALEQQQAKSKAQSIAGIIVLVATLVLWIATPIGFVASVVLGGIAGLGYLYSPLGKSRLKAASPATVA
jgi:hypothetical protein